VDKNRPRPSRLENPHALANPLTGNILLMRPPPASFKIGIGIGIGIGIENNRWAKMMS
jgi:hypothetical protein